MLKNAGGSQQLSDFQVYPGQIHRIFSATAGNFELLVQELVTCTRFPTPLTRSFLRMDAILKYFADDFHRKSRTRCASICGKRVGNSGRILTPADVYPQARAHAVRCRLWKTTRSPGSDLPAPSQDAAKSHLQKLAWINARTSIQKNNGGSFYRLLHSDVDKSGAGSCPQHPLCK